MIFVISNVFPFLAIKARIKHNSKHENTPALNKLMM